MTPVSRPVTKTSHLWPRPAIGRRRNSGMGRCNAIGWALGLTLVVGLSFLCAQDRQENAGDAFWEVRQRQEAAAAAQLVLSRDPLTLAALRELGFRWKVWREPEFLGAKAPAL